MAEKGAFDDYHRGNPDDPPPQYSGYPNISSLTSTNAPYPQQSVMPQPSSIQNIPPPPPQPSVIYVVQARLRESPTQCVCPNCKANILTKTSYNSGLATYLLAGGLCIFGFWFGCCLIPFCVDACKDVDHYCPNCRCLIGRYKRIS